MMGNRSNEEFRREIEWIRWVILWIPSHRELALNAIMQRLSLLPVMRLEDFTNIYEGRVGSRTEVQEE